MLVCVCRWHLPISLDDFEYKRGNPYTLWWRHNGRDGVSNHQPLDCLLNHLFRRRSEKTSKLHVTGLCAGNSPATGEFPAQMASNAENVSIWWRHNDMRKSLASALSDCDTDPFGLFTERHSFSRRRWFHGHLRREQADELLKPHENGMFLVRESSNFPGDYTLCLCSVGDIKHYRIMCRGNILTIDDEHIFENLHQLVEVSCLRLATLGPV